MATIGGALLLPPCVGPASITAVALSAVAMRANAEHGFASVAASRSKQDFWHPDDDKPPLRSGDDADGSLLNRRVIKKLHFLMRGDSKTDLNSFGYELAHIKPVRLEGKFRTAQLQAFKDHFKRLMSVNNMLLVPKNIGL